MQDALRGIQDKTTHLTFKDLRRLLFRCAALLLSKEEVWVPYLIMTTVSDIRCLDRLWACSLSGGPAFCCNHAVGHLFWNRRMDLAYC
jgi:hypothetical protein